MNHPFNDAVFLPAGKGIKRKHKTNYMKKYIEKKVNDKHKEICYGEDDKTSIIDNLAEHNKYIYSDNKLLYDIQSFHNPKLQIKWQLDLLEIMQLNCVRGVSLSRANFQQYSKEFQDAFHKERSRLYNELK